MTHCLCKHDCQGYNLFDTLPDQWLHIASASMIVGDVIFFMILCQTNDGTCLCKLYDTPPDQWWHMPLQTLWYSTRPMMTHYLHKHDRWGCKFFYNTPPDQQWHIASANMTAGDVNFLIILRWTNNDIASANMTAGDVNFFIILRRTKNHTLPPQIWPAAM